MQSGYGSGIQPHVLFEIESFQTISTLVTVLRKQLNDYTVRSRRILQRLDKDTQSHSLLTSNCNGEWLPLSSSTASSCLVLSLPPLEKNHLPKSKQNGFVWQKQQLLLGTFLGVYKRYATLLENIFNLIVKQTRGIHPTAFDSTLNNRTLQVLNTNEIDYFQIGKLIVVRELGNGECSPCQIDDA